MNSRIWWVVVFVWALVAIEFVWIKTVHAEDRIVFDSYTKHSSDCQYAYAKTCKQWEQPKRVSWQRTYGDFATDLGAGSNSYGKTSYNAGGMYLPIHVGNVRMGAFGSFVSGYNCNQLKTCFIAGGVVADYSADGIVMQVLYVPAIGGGTVSVVNVRLGFVF